MRIRRIGDWRLTRAPAKVNLGLRVVGRRADGYHLLDSLVAFADIGDHVAIRPAPAPALSLRGPFAATLADGRPEANLAFVAAERFRDRFGGGPVEIRLWKRLPVAAGIGGGSADGAAVLRLLADISDVAPDDPDLARTSLDLGADGPMCLAGAAARAGGIGERLAPAPGMPPLPVVLANPGVPVATPDVFRARAGGFSDEATLASAYADAAEVAAAVRVFGNDLEAPARRIASEVGDVLAALGGSPGTLHAQMSGSGATAFGLFPDLRAARAAARSLARARPGWWVRAATLNA